MYMYILLYIYTYIDIYRDIFRELWARLQEGYERDDRDHSDYGEQTKTAASCCFFDNAPPNNSSSSSGKIVKWRSPAPSSAAGGTCP